MCEYCDGAGWHRTQCPNYEPNLSIYVCVKCNENIAIGEEYIVNDNNEYAHWDCIDFSRDLADFLGYEVKEMVDD